MLGSEEGQLNSVFAYYGSASQQGLLFEDSQPETLGLQNRSSGVDDLEA